MIVHVTGNNSWKSRLAAGLAMAVLQGCSGGERSEREKEALQWQQLKGVQLQLIASVSYMLFAMTCFDGKARLFQSQNPISAPVNALFEALTPPSLEFPLWVRGLLGVIASSVEYLH